MWLRTWTFDSSNLSCWLLNYLREAIATDSLNAQRGASHFATAGAKSARGLLFKPNFPVDRTA